MPPPKPPAKPAKAPRVVKIDGKLINVDASLIALDRVDCAESLAMFIKLAWPIVEPNQEYIHGWHIDAICEHLEAITDGVTLPDGTPYNRLLINIPPGTMKSLAVGVFWPAWEWGPRKMPSMRYLCASHSQELAIRDNMRMRRLVTSEWYQDRWPHITLTADQNQKTKFENSETGWRQAAAAGSLTGARGDRVLVDDPHSVEGASSEQQRKSTIEWFTEAVPTRLNNPDRSAIVVVMQRLHEEDVSGCILEKKLGYDHLCLPMRATLWRRDFPTLLGFVDPREDEGELLFPDRFPLDVVERDERTMGPYASAGQFQQEPAPRGGGIIKRDWWKPWTETAFPAMDYIVASLDTAYTEKSENDPSALTVWGVFSGAQDQYASGFTAAGGRLVNHGAQSALFDEGLQVRARAVLGMNSAPRVVLMDAWAERLELHDLVTRVAATCRKMKVDVLLVEGKASGHSVAQEIRRVYSHENWAVRVVDARGGPRGLDKAARLHSVVHIFAEGMVYAPDRNWADMVITEVAVFPKGRHDDLCLVGDTRVVTALGERPIRDVKTGDQVLTPLGWRRVLAAGVTGIAPVVSAHGVTGTANHPVFGLRSWERLDTVSMARGLTLCSLIQTIRLKPWSLKTFCTDEWAEAAGITYPSPQRTPVVKTPKGCTSLFGNIFQAFRSHEAAKYTIETAILLIAALRIWSAFRKARIAGTVSEWRRGIWNIWRRFAHWLPHGINPMPAVSGIAEYPPNLWAKPEPPETQRPTKQESAASFAERRSVTEILGNNTVPIVVPAAPCALVYNLSVEEAKCFYANRVLVHNCDTVSMAIRHLRDTGMLVRAPEWTADATEALRGAERRALQPIYPV